MTLTNDHHEEEIRVACNSECLEKIRVFIRQKATSFGFSQGEVGRLVLAVDEVSSNIVKHAYRFEADRKLNVTWREDQEKAIVELQDDSSEPYLPSETDFDLPTKVKYRHSNGYGKYLIQSLVDDVLYETIPGSHNKISLIKYRPGQKKTTHTTSIKKAGLLSNPYDMARSRSQSLLSLLDLTDFFGQEKDPENIIRLFLYGLMGLFTSYPVAFLVPGNKPEPFHLGGHVGLSRSVVAADLAFPRYGWVAETLRILRGPFLADDLRKMEMPEDEIQTIDRLRTGVLIPIFVFDHLRAIVSLGNKRNHQAFSEEDMRLTQMLASHTLLLLENLKNYQPKNIHHLETSKRV